MGNLGDWNNFIPLDVQGSREREKLIERVSAGELSRDAAKTEIARIQAESDMRAGQKEGSASARGSNLNRVGTTGLFDRSVTKPKYASGGKVRGAGTAQRGTKTAKMR